MIKMDSFNLNEHLTKMLDIFSGPAVIPIQDFVKELRDRKNKIDSIRSQLANIAQLQSYLQVQLEIEEATMSSLLNSVNITESQEKIVRNSNLPSQPTQE